MIILDRVAGGGEITQQGVPTQNVVEVSVKDESTCWVKFWTGSETRSMVVADTIEEIQKKMYEARHGKKKR